MANPASPTGIADSLPEGGDTSEANAEIDGKQPGELDGEELLQKLKNWFTDGRNASSEWRKQARESYGFYSNVQWSADDVATLMEERRPVITFNRVAPTIDTVSGMEVNNRQEIKGYARSQGVAQSTEQLNHAIKWVRDDCDAEDEESDAFLDVLIGGVAFVGTRLDVDQDPAGTIVEERLDPLEGYWDSYARKRNLTDRRWCAWLRKVDRADAKDMFPDADEGDLHAQWADSGETDVPQPHDATEAKWYREDQSDRDKSTRKQVTIVQFQWFEKEAQYKTVEINPADPSAPPKIVTLDKEKFQKASARWKELTGQKLPSVKFNKRVYKQAFVGRVILEQGDCPCKEDFTFQFITGKRDRNKKSWYGIVEAMKDPQRWANKFFATILHNIATQGKGIIAEKDAFEDPRKAESEWSRPDAITWAKPGAVAAGKIIPKPAGQLPAGLSDMLTFALGSLRDVSGVNLETLGQADRDQPASLEWQRRKSAFSILAGYFDALRHFRKTQGRLTIWMIQEYISDGRLMRVEGNDGTTQYVPLNRDPTVTEYDIIVDDAPSSPDQKEATWMIISQMMPMLTKLPIPMPVWIEILKNSPLPDSVSMKIGQLLQEQAQQPPPPDPKLLLAQAQIEKIHTETDIAGKQSQQELQLKAAEHQMDMEQEQQKTQQAITIQAAQAESEKEIEQAELQHDLVIETVKAKNAIEIEREKAAVTLDIKKQEFAEKKRQGAYKPQPKGKK